MTRRAVAYKLKLADLLKGEYVAGGSIDNPNYIKVGDVQVTRVNTLGKVVDKYENAEAQYSSLTIEDNETQMKVKIYGAPNLSEYQNGDLVKVIGKVRENEEERFILGEIISLIKHPEYVKLRELELSKTVVQPAAVKEEEQKESLVEDAGSI